VVAVKRGRLAKIPRKPVNVSGKAIYDLTLIFTRGLLTTTTMNTDAVHSYFSRLIQGARSEDVNQLESLFQFILPDEILATIQPFISAVRSVHPCYSLIRNRWNRSYKSQTQHKIECRISKIPVENLSIHNGRLWELRTCNFSTDIIRTTETCSLRTFPSSLCMSLVSLIQNLCCDIYSLFGILDDAID
jgi:hypothetical protein